MISRRTTIILGNLYQQIFSHTTYHARYGHKTTIYKENLYDYLYGHNYPAWFCNMAKGLMGKRGIQEWIMKLHTGETQHLETITWDQEAKEKLGQQYLRDLAEDTLNTFQEADEKQ